MRAATRGKQPNPVRVLNLARLALCYVQIVAGYGSPSDVRRACASPAIDAMTIAQRKGPTLQHVTCPAANASTRELQIFLKLLSLLRD